MVCNSFIKIIKNISFLALAVCSQHAVSDDYYVSSSEGQSGNPGTLSLPWETTEDVNSRMAQFQPGDNIFFKKGDVWREQLNITVSGNAGSPVTFSSYGTGPRPVFKPTDEFSQWIKYTIVKNSSFERPGIGDATDVFLDWAELVDNTAGDSDSYIARSTDVLNGATSTGNYSAELHFALPSKNVYLTQNVYIKENKDYFLSFLSKVTQGERLRLRVQLELFDGVDKYYKYLNSAGDWQDQLVEVGYEDTRWNSHGIKMATMPVGSVKIKVYFLHGKRVSASSVWIDRVAIEAYGETSSNNWQTYSEAEAVSLSANASFEVAGSNGETDAFQTWGEVIDHSAGVSSSFIAQSIDHLTGGIGSGNVSAELHFSPPSKNVYIYQNILVDEGIDYQFSFLSKVSAGDHLRLRVRLEYSDGQFQYLNNAGNWQDALTEINYEDTNWTNHALDLQTIPVGAYRVRMYFLHGKQTESSILVDNAFLVAKDINSLNIWQGYSEGIKTTLGALIDGERITVKPNYPELDPLTLNDGEFHSATNRHYFYYRNDAGVPPVMEVGVRKHALWVDYSQYVTVRDINVTGPSGVNVVETSAATSGYNLLKVSNSDNVMLDNMDISHSYTVGARITEGSTNSSYNNVVAYEHGSTCLYFSVAGSGNSAINTEVYNCGNRENDSGDMGGIGVWRTPDVLIENCYVHDNGHIGAEKIDAAISVVQSPGAILRRNVVKNSGGMAIQFAEWSDNSEASYNIIDKWAVKGGLYGEGLRVGGGVQGIDPDTGLLRTSCLNCKVFNNLFINGGIKQGGWGALAFLKNLNHSSVQVKNNIFYNNLGIYEIKVENHHVQPALMTGAEFSNNIFYRVQGNAIRWHGDIYGFDNIIGNSAGNYSFDHTQGENSAAIDPQLSDPLNGNYQLLPLSPARDKGVDVGFLFDANYATVVGNPDIGPFEYPDFDNDGIDNALDNCVTISNQNQLDQDEDGQGDACDNDIDGDGDPNQTDCEITDPTVYNGATEIKHDGLDQDCNGYDLTIEIIDAKIKGGNLIVRATSSYGESASLSVINYPGMKWQSRKQDWQLKTSHGGNQPPSVIVTGVEGEVTAVVTQ